MARHVEAMVGFMDAGAEVFDYGNSIRAEAQLGGYDRAFAFPGFVPAYIRPLFCEGRGPFRWAALSGDPADIAATDRAVLELFPENEALARWIRMAGEKVHFEGLPARICWLGHGERHLAGLRFNEMVASGELKAPVVIGRDHLDCGSVASPYRETEGMLDGSDAIADWPLLNALVNTASGATWVSLHHGGGVGIGRSIHAGQVTVADGTAARRAEARARADQRPGDGDRAPRRRGLRAGGGGRGGARRAHPDAGGRLTRYWAEHAWLGGDRAESGVLIEVRGDEIAAVALEAERDGATILRGLTLPGLANAHSHAFHRALRGRTHRGGGTFWTWREDMYAVAERLDPDSYRALARAVFGEMALAGITCVGEFHYLHHGAAPYDEPNAMGDALIDGGGRGRDPHHAARHVLPRERLRRRRPRASRSASPTGTRRPGPSARRRCATRRTPASAPRSTPCARSPPTSSRPSRGGRASAARRCTRTCPSSAPRTRPAWPPTGRTPAELLDEHGALGAHCCMVHATHLTRRRRRRLGGTAVCMCATTERDLADGIGPARALADAGAPCAWAATATP